MAVQYMSPLQSALKSGQELNLCGKIPDNCEGFSINLSTVEKITEGGDIALHISVQFNMDAVVIKRSCFMGGKWLEEECDDSSVDLKEGGPFMCTINVTDDGYKISFMGKYYCFYKHRIALKKVTHMIVEGDVEIITTQNFSQDDRGEGRKKATSQSADLDEWRMKATSQSADLDEWRMKAMTKSDDLGEWRMKAMTRSATVYIYGCHVGTVNNNDYKDSSSLPPYWRRS